MGFWGETAFVSAETWVLSQGRLTRDATGTSYYPNRTMNTTNSMRGVVLTLLVLIGVTAGLETNISDEASKDCHNTRPWFERNNALLDELKNSRNNSRCLIIGNGPSLNKASQLASSIARTTDVKTPRLR